MSDRKRSFNVIGKPRRRVDGRAKVTGGTRFADDMTLPRMVHCKLLRSPHPHARIVSIDTSRAGALDGVLLVLTGADLPIAFGILPVSQDEEALCGERVRFVGDPVAAVIAREEATAADALAKFLACNVGHGDERLVIDSRDFIDRTNVGVIEYRSGAGFLQKACAFLFIGE